jgi:hypothetical protein
VRATASGHAAEGTRYGVVVSLGVVLALVAKAATHAFAPTPQGAALAAMYADPMRPPAVKRVNSVGAYATVLTSGGRIEGSPVTFAILVERFSFGWQALDILNSTCRLDAHRLGRSADEALVHGMPKPRDDRPCGSLLNDAGPHGEVEAIRQMMRGPLVPSVVVSGDWAMAEWYGGGGGESLYRKRGGGWQLVEDGGGAMGVDYMRKFGVPQSDWCAFGIFDAKCR